MKHTIINKTTLLISFLILFAFFSACDSSPAVTEQYAYDFSCEYKITDEPTGTNTDNLAFVLQLPAQEGENTNLSISVFKVYKNEALIFSKENFKRAIEYNSWVNSEGKNDSNYQLVIHCLPEGFTDAIKLEDKIRIQFECTADRVIKNTVKKHLIDNSTAVGLWKNVGTEISSSEQNTKPVQNNIPHDYSFNYLYKINVVPTGNKKENLTLVYQQSIAEGTETDYSITELKVYQNDVLITNTSGETSKLWYNQWTNSDGSISKNYMTTIRLLPDNFSGQIQKNDKIKIILKIHTSREFVNPIIPVLIDNSKEVNYWMVLGEPTFDYAATPVPDESIIYNEQTYKLVFNEDFNEDFSEKNPLKNGLYKQAFDMNNWWTEDWGSYTNHSNGEEHRTIRDFTIHDGYAEFPMVKRYFQEDGTWKASNQGPSLVTSVWDPKGVNSDPLFEFNKGIFEIKFMGPEGTDHPGQFTFWVLNYHTDFEAPDTNGKYPTNPNKASDGYALDEIDFFEYSPSYNGTGCIRMGTRSCNGINSRPAAGYGKKILNSSFGGKWHVFRCIWDDKGLTAYLDGNYMSSISASSIKGFDNPDDKFMMLISSQSISESGIDGSVYSDFEPYSYYVDYIKVYEKQ